MSRADVPIIKSIVTYLEMLTDPGLPAVDIEGFTLVRAEQLPVREYLEIYRQVGRDYLWNYRPGQSEEEISAILNSPATLIYLLKEGERTVGMAEVVLTEPGDVELVHFGVVPSVINRGVGRRFLQNVMHLVWSTGIRRLWLSTCGMDHPKAIRFYQSAGFVVFKTKMGEFKDWRFTGFYSMSDAPQIPYGERPGARSRDVSST